MDPNAELLAAIRARQEKSTEFNYGILTADRYVRTLLDSAGSDACYLAASKGMVSFADVLTKAAETLVYSNEDSEVHEKATDQYAKTLPEGIVLPKNTLMVFRHTLSTPRKDRDGDILRSEGRECDPKMLLLWQHVHTMPIGKMLVISIQNKKTLDLWSAIVDINETSHDAAVMVDNGMGRFSHGFKATEFTKVKVDGKDTGGFDIKHAEVMEESLVSVPSNTDADTQEVILSLVEGGKLTSPMMKEIGKGIRDKRNVTVPVKIELENQDEKLDDKGTETGTPKETGDWSGGEDKGQQEDKTKTPDPEVKQVTVNTLPDSWEDIQGDLYESIRLYEQVWASQQNEYDRYVYSIGTFDGYVILCYKDYNKPSEIFYKVAWKFVDGKATLVGDLIEVDIQLTADIVEKGLNTKADPRSEMNKTLAEKKESESVTDWLVKSTKEDRIQLIDVLKHLNDREDAEEDIKAFKVLMGESQ